MSLISFATQTETFTQKPWEELYNDAIKVVPFLLVGRVLVNPSLKDNASTGSEHQHEWYDGTHLKKYLKDGHSLSPLTRKEIRQAEYFCIKAEATENQEINRQPSIRLLPVDAFQFSKAAANNEQFFFDSLNSFSALQAPLQAGKIQKIVSSRLQESNYQSLWNNYSEQNIIKATLV
ncbi:hypothetical protein [Simkania sp.]|uniref:hypothetical protein n=1 Tax=Simkania sp. TaxID=34094 RepID=UPI003B516E83